MTGTASSPYPEALALVQYPHPVLRKLAAPVTEFNPQLAAFCQAMLDAMRTWKGVGLAAPQVGVSLRIFVTDHLAGDPEAEPAPRVWINPRIIEPRGQRVYEEGCLSFPRLYANVTRYDAFTVCWQGLDGNQHQEAIAAGDFLGIVVQHEFDHLDGILFVDHLSPGQLQLVRRKLREMEQAYKRETGRLGAVLRR